MKYQILTLLFLLFFSCKKENKEINKDLLRGNWYTLNGENYLEFNIDDSLIYTYSNSWGNWMKYKYELNGNNLYCSFDHPDLKEDSFDNYLKIINIDSNTVTLTKGRTLKRIKDSISLGYYVLQGEKAFKSYNRAAILRERKLKEN